MQFHYLLYHLFSLSLSVVATLESRDRDNIQLDPIKRSREYRDYSGYSGSMICKIEHNGSRYRRKPCFDSEIVGHYAKGQEVRLGCYVWSQ
jgi:hypothetical protein